MCNIGILDISVDGLVLGKFFINKIGKVDINI